jgi:hypothetical protein
MNSNLAATAEPRELQQLQQAKADEEGMEEDTDK